MSHKKEEHAENVHYDGHGLLEIESKFICNFCKEKFENKSNLMKHNKEIHAENVSPCWKFASGHCALGDERCWFLDKENHSSHINSEYQCNSCDETFHSKSILMKHRKLRHIHTVKPCSHDFKGDCKFGNEKCWFVHNDSEILDKKDKGDEAVKYNKEVFDKLFKMMEKMTERIIHMENKI
jgi:hypothetical protein